MIKILLNEWQEILPNYKNGLINFYFKNYKSQKIVEKLKEKKILQIDELKKGLRIRSFSYVGKIEIENVQIKVITKIDKLPLLRLLKYTYNLKDLKILEKSLYSLKKTNFFDILIYQLYLEIETIYRLGLIRFYKRQNDYLKSPRGIIDINRLYSKKYPPPDALPCIYYERNSDNLLNSLLIAGLKLALQMTDSSSLKQKLSLFYRLISEHTNHIKINNNNIKKAFSMINRLNSHYLPALNIIKLLFEVKGLSMENSMHYFNGFFFDMNKFFQDLLSKLADEFLINYNIKKEYVLSNLFEYDKSFNPKGRNNPKIRPDFAVLKKDKVILFIDAKYRDLWEKPLPREMLYQLTIYSFSGVESNQVKILYPTMNETAIIQKIKFKNPANNKYKSEIILQPVLLSKISNLLFKNNFELEKYTNEIFFLQLKI
ncbi:5-methylcytosine-specific restriction enzyme subunit McrC [Marinitoga hydrogenitolerans DSM 16785]|uniref:5-methylcytosine-specific restriction enzyme subunit McrC n=1 Tax=Marinitoga hydrogenitolerans (strain DSM 16785 / JCM 12826 / AT1271) TaxID=1122195 RepID=A0A1M4SQF3_MARH1|nr:hypothetical protein [Marinitoga hydrogenitolerans]SHE34405.1 5-methylcytosine-specific restriction enzyme subunit McrC [Marinitoga hydrogenitolerans DSM 16785]